MVAKMATRHEFEESNLKRSHLRVHHHLMFHYFLLQRVPKVFDWIHYFPSFMMITGHLATKESWRMEIDRNCRCRELVVEERGFIVGELM